jgi:hypothetical protein
MMESSKLPPKVQAWAERQRTIKDLGKETVIRECVGTAVARYCGKCPDTGTGCPDCRVYDFMQKSGVDVL